MKSRVMVELVARQTVVVVVEHDPDDDPADLHPVERARAFALWSAPAPVIDSSEVLEVAP